MVTQITSSVLSIWPNSHSTWSNIIRPLLYSFPFIKRCVAMCTALPILLIIIHPFIYSSPFIQDPVSLKHPEAKHSSAHQGRINVRQCAHFRHILSNILSILNHSETNHILYFNSSWHFCFLTMTEGFWKLPWYLCRYISKISETFSKCMRDVQSFLAHLCPDFQACLYT